MNLASRAAHRSCFLPALPPRRRAGKAALANEQDRRQPSDGRVRRLQRRRAGVPWPRLWYPLPPTVKAVLRAAAVRAELAACSCAQRDACLRCRRIRRGLWPQCRGFVRAAWLCAGLRVSHGAAARSGRGEHQWQGGLHLWLGRGPHAEDGGQAGAVFAEL